MPNLTSRRFTDPDTLRKIKHECLLAWLAPAKGYFGRRGVVVPEPGVDGEIDYDKLADVFMEPEEDMPHHLVNSLYIIHEMCDEHGMDAILEEFEDREAELDIGDEHEPADVAVQAWLLDGERLEEIHNQHFLTRPRSFIYFSADAKPLPAFEKPTAAQRRALEARLDDWYAKKKRGRGARVFAYPKDGECWFLVRHGLPCKREGAIKDGKSESVFYRPLKHDVLVYDAEVGEIRVSCCGKRELEQFLKAFGMHLFGKEDFFPGKAKYTLAPLMTAGRDCLACLDVEGIDGVVLKDVEFSYRGRPWQRIMRKSDDIFALVEAERFRWPPDAEMITRAGFEITFTGTKKARRVTVIPSNKAQYGRDEDSVLVEKWLKARGFIGEVLANEEDEEPVE